MALPGETKIQTVERLISTKSFDPVIVNEQSNFIMTTYWWGRNNLNMNTARPCNNYYERLLKLTTNLCLKVLNTVGGTYKTKVYNNLENSVIELEPFKKMIRDQAIKYNVSIYEHLNLTTKGKEFPQLDQEAIEKLEKLKGENINESANRTPVDYEYKNIEYTSRMLTLIMKHAIKISKHIMIELFFAKKQLHALVLQFNKAQSDNSLTEALKATFKTNLNEQSDKVNRLDNAIKSIFKAPITTKFITELNRTVTTTFKTPAIDYDYPDELQEYKQSGLSIYGILNKEFQFVMPIKYAQMILNWEEECRKNNCNYMTVEYPEFNEPGGYQLAINAKCFYIKRALQASGRRSIVYIDGDMFVRKYPEIFDLKGIDYMARCWGMDPRSSSNVADSILYDPYTFETSGGIMFFSQSPESYMLCDLWNSETRKPAQAGKADDRIISLVINSYKLLLSMKILLLPIEYLWLSLDYDARLISDDEIYYIAEQYKYSSEIMKHSIFIEHPECLTSEDTATGAGAASDRTPKYYSFLYENNDPVSESFHEYINFPSKAFAENVYGTYLEFMSNTYYIDDGNTVLEDKGFVNPGGPSEDNEQPLYVTKYDAKYGNTKYINQRKYPDTRYNDVAILNNKLAGSMNIDSLGLVTVADKMIEINDISKFTGKHGPAKLVRLIIRLLATGNKVIYNPVGQPGYEPLYYDLLKTKLRSNFRNMELIFVPNLTKSGDVPTSINYFYKPKIMTNQVMYFKPNLILIKFLHMFLSLSDLSLYLSRGSYQFMSRIRIGYLINDIKMNMIKFTEDIVELGEPQTLDEDQDDEQGPAPAQAVAQAQAQAAPPQLSYSEALQSKKLLLGGTDDADAITNADANTDTAFIDLEYIPQDDLSTQPEIMVELYDRGLDVLNTEKEEESEDKDYSNLNLITGGKRRNKTKKKRFVSSTKKHNSKKHNSKKHNKKTRKHRKINKKTKRH